MPQSDTKVCNGCLDELPVSEFHVRRDRGTRRARCRRCESSASMEYQRRRRAEDPGFVEVLRERRLKRQFGISVEQYDDLFAFQGGVCAICGRPPTTKRLAVDHDHETGEVRGLLCSDCNTGIGLLGDRPENMERAARYLAKEFGPLEAQV